MGLDPIDWGGVCEGERERKEGRREPLFYAEVREKEKEGEVGKF